MSRWVDTSVKERVNDFTEKEFYQFGDLTKEILKRVVAGKYDANDLFILLKGLAVTGAKLSPFAGALPTKSLVKLLNFALLGDIKGKVSFAFAAKLDAFLSSEDGEERRIRDLMKRVNDTAGKVGASLAMELDRRLKALFLGDGEYKLGDGTRQAIARLVREYTGKDEYEFGDVTRKAAADLRLAGASDAGSAHAPSLLGAKTARDDVAPAIAAALDEWDALSKAPPQERVDDIERYVGLVERSKPNGTDRK